jgi:hypothetical protein
MGRRRRYGQSGPGADPSPPQALPQDLSTANTSTETNSLQEAFPAAVAAAEWICSVTHQELVNQQNSEALAARAFLQFQGSAWPAVGKLPLGIIGDPSQLRARYIDQQMGPEEAIGYWLDDPRLNQVLVGPVRDRDGKLITLWARSIEPGRKTLLYRHPWLDRVGVYGREHLSTVGTKLVFAVERILDALILRSHGIEPVVALGRRFDQVPGESWAVLCREELRSLILLPVGPHVSASIFRGVRVQIERLVDPPEVWVLPPKRMFAPLGRMAAMLKASEFAEYIRDRGVALVGRRGAVRVVRGVSAKRPGKPAACEEEDPRKAEVVQPDAANRLVRDVTRSVDWLAFD